MPNHVFDRKAVIEKLESVLNRTLGEIDNKGIFDIVQGFNLQKGVAGAVIEQCVFGYPPDSKQEADLVIVDGGERRKTELKTTGMVIHTEPVKHYVPKEPMSITAVGVYDIAEQTFWTSHFWEKLEHMLVVYYHYTASNAVSAYDYRDFPLMGYEFHVFSEDDVQTLKRDWEHVHALCAGIIARNPGAHTVEWKAAVKQEYIALHGQLRRVLSFIDLAPRFPPRFRLKKSTVTSMISRHFGYALEQLPGRYITVSDIDRRCHQLAAAYAGKTIYQLARQFGIPYDRNCFNKGITEQIVVAMFGGTARKLNQIEQFEKFGLIAKSIVVTSSGARTEDMKLFHLDFSELMQTEVFDEENRPREYQFEDSALYAYFADNEFLCILFEEPQTRTVEVRPGLFAEISHTLGDNTFVGFKRLVFDDAFIDTTVKAVWIDTREKIQSGTLVDVISRDRAGKPVFNRSGGVRSTPNFIKSSDNDVFLRGSGVDSSLRYKTECVNGIRMLPQYVWMKGKAVVDRLRDTPEL